MKLTLLLALLVFVELASGQEAVQNSEDETQCSGNTYDMSVCLSTSLKKIDAQLNDYYRKALKVTKRFTPQDEQNLKAAQKAWLTYRDAACKAEYDLWGGGSGGPNAHTMCIIRLTKQRSTDLHNAYLQER